MTPQPAAVSMAMSSTPTHAQITSHPQQHQQQQQPAEQRHGYHQQQYQQPMVPPPVPAHMQIQVSAPGQRKSGSPMDGVTNMI